MDNPLVTKTFRKGDIIISQGEPATTAYMIDSGKVRVYLKKDGRIVDLAQLGPDEIFGESALFNGTHYGAFVEAMEDTELTLITPDIMAIKMKQCDPMLRAMIQMLIERQQRTNQALLQSETREFIEIAFV